MPRMLFEKLGDSIWISHLDLMRVFQRSFRRAGLLLKHSQGFTPRAIVSIALPMSVGVESQCELLDFELADGSCPTAEQINGKLPAGIRILSIYQPERKIKELTYLRAGITLTYDNGVPGQATDGISALFHRESLILEKHSHKGTSQTDIIPMLRSIQVNQPDIHTIELNALVCAQNPSLNPQLLVSALDVYAPQWVPDGTRIRRMEIYDANENIFR